MSKYSTILLYNPIDPTLVPHPSDTKSNDNAKRGREEEDKLMKRVIRKTVNSGAIYGDGDFSLLSDYRMEHKLRPAKVKSYSLSKAEYEKGLKQGIDIWAITVEGEETIYMMREKLFIEVVRLLSERKRATEEV